MASPRRIDVHFHLIPPVLQRGRLRGWHRPGDRPLSRLDTRTRTRADGCARHRGRTHLAGVAGRRLRHSGERPGAGAPLQRLCGRAGRALAQALRCLRHCADVGRGRGDRRGHALARRAQARRRLAVCELWREISRRSVLRSGPGRAQRAAPWSSSIPACTRRARGSPCRGRDHLEYFDTRGRWWISFSPARSSVFPRIRFILPHASGFAVLCLAAVGVADDRQAAAAALARAGALRAAAFLVRQRALAERGDFRRARSGGAAQAHRVRHRLPVRQSTGDCRDGQDPQVRASCRTPGGSPSIAAMRWRCFEIQVSRAATPASPSRRSGGDIARRIDRPYLLGQFLRAPGPRHRPDQIELAFSPASSSGTMREPSASSASWLKALRAVVTVRGPGAAG